MDNQITASEKLRSAVIGYFKANDVKKVLPELLEMPFVKEIELGDQQKRKVIENLSQGDNAFLLRTRIYGHGTYPKAKYEFSRRNAKRNDQEIKQTKQKLAYKKRDVEEISKHVKINVNPKTGVLHVSVGRITYEVSINSKN